MSLGTELQSILRPGGGASLLSSWRDPNTGWFCRKPGHQLAIPHRARPHPTLSSHWKHWSSHWKHCFSKLGIVGERGRGGQSSVLSSRDTTLALVLIKWLTFIFHPELAGAGQGLGLMLARLPYSQPGMPLLWTSHFSSLVYFSMHL